MPVKKFSLFLHKFTHWEYWPFDVVYFPMYFVWFYYAVRARAFFFATAANPKIQNGGFLMESKKEIYDMLPESSYPKTIKIKLGSTPEEIRHEIENFKLIFPLIAKPDIGLRGMAIQKLDTFEDVATYITKIKVDFLLQEYIDLPLEAGIFYVRIPGETFGKITGIVWKEFVIVEGNGVASLRELIETNPRFHLQLTAMEKLYGSKLDHIPKRNEFINLVPYGNHARGSKFTDASSRINEKLTAFINSICTKVPEFYYGRLDIRFKSFEDLEDGKNYSVIELNGAGSDPTHIYDPSHSIFFAWREIMRHFKYLYKISSLNMKAGIRCLTITEGLSMLKANRAHIKKLKAFSDQ